jgi:hypothetical protein
MMRNTLPPLASNDLLCFAEADQSILFKRVHSLVELGRDVRAFVLPPLNKSSERSNDQHQNKRKKHVTEADIKEKVHQWQADSQRQCPLYGHVGDKAQFALRSCLLPRLQALLSSM